MRLPCFLHAKERREQCSQISRFFFKKKKKPNPVFSDASNAVQTRVRSRCDALIYLIDVIRWSAQLMKPDILK